MEAEKTPAEIKEEEAAERTLHYTGFLPIILLFVIIVARISYDCYRGKRIWGPGGYKDKKRYAYRREAWLRHQRQKTRNPQRRRQQGAQRGPSLPPQEPTIYVSPANLPPPPKYEALAPPSYDEVVGIHYPQYVTHPGQHTHQPITVPITTALSQNYDISPQTSTANESSTDPAPTVITVTADERRTSVTVARS